jgi:hypothetical protein
MIGWKSQRRRWLEMAKIIWFAEDGSVLRETIVDDADGLDEYIQETTEGMDAPDGWDTYQVEEVA